MKIQTKHFFLAFLILLIIFIIIQIKNFYFPFQDNEIVDIYFDLEQQYCLCNHDYNHEFTSCENRFYDLNNQFQGSQSSTKFYIKSLNTTNKYECKLSKHTCLGYDLVTKRKCNSQTVIGFEYCKQHLKQFCNLEIKNSKLYPQAGVGVFASRNNRNKNNNEIIFKKGDMIAKYNGEFLDNIDYKIRYKNIFGPYVLHFNETSVEFTNDGPYSIYFNETHTIDSACRRGTACLINHRKERKGSNARYSSKKNGLFVYAIRDIKDGDEIFADYGDNYMFETNFKTI